MDFKKLAIERIETELFMAQEQEAVCLEHGDTEGMEVAKQEIQALMYTLSKINN